MRDRNVRHDFDARVDHLLQQIAAVQVRMPRIDLAWIKGVFADASETDGIRPGGAAEFRAALRVKRQFGRKRRPVRIIQKRA